MQFAFLIGKVLTQKWQPNPTYEYYLSSQKKSFDEAQSSCRQSPDGADLVMIKTLEIQTFIEGIIPEGNRNQISSTIILIAVITCRLFNCE